MNSETGTKNIIARRAGEELVAVDLSTGDAFSMNVTAADIFEKYRSGESPGEIAAYLNRAYEIDTEAALAEIEELLEALRLAGLLAEGGA